MISDAAVIDRIRAGDADAFGILVERYQPSCARLAVRLLDDPDDAADAVQEAFIRAYTGLDRYVDDGRFAAWLMTIVTNRCRSAVRSRATAIKRPLDDNDLVETPAPEDFALQAHLERALSALPEETRNAIIAKHFDGITYRELAEREGERTSTLKMRVARGTAQLRRTLTAAGLALAAAGLLALGNTHRASVKQRSTAVVACDTLRALMHDTLGSVATDTLMPPSRCRGDATAALVHTKAIDRRAIIR